MTDNQDRQFSQDQGADRDRQQQQEGRPTPQGQQQDGMGQGQQQQSQHGQQDQQNQQDQYRDQDHQQQRESGQGQQHAGSGTSASGITGQRDDSSGISGGAPAGEGGGAEQYGMETKRARDQEQQQVGTDPKIREDQVEPGQGGSYGS